MTGSALSFVDRTIIITGAGRGIGRAYALELGRRGAAVLVNDISLECAQSVAAEIVDAGGAAQASQADVTSAEACGELVEAARRAFGGVDAVIANASINSARKSFTAISLAELQAMLSVNIVGAWSLLQAAWPLLVKTGRGRVLLTTSQAALYGMPMLSEYALAKGAMIGLMRTLAHEGEPNGVKVNAIAPAAATRMTEETVKDERALTLLRDLQPPERVAPAAALLVHDTCPVSGEIFLAGGGHMARVFIGETRGVTLPADQLRTEVLAERFPVICSEDGYRVPRNISETGNPDQKAEIFARLRALGIV
jgi:NAD(P)-dependent dehydrogenase (short-subunit alcohol dehydrogenase family)